MEKIYLSAPWDRNDITRTWSGTSFQLYHHLSKLRKVEILYSPKNNFTNFLGKCSNFANSFYFKKLKTIYSSYYIAEQIKDVQIPVLSIGAIRAFKSPTYLYVDNLYCSLNLTKKFVAEGWGYAPWGNVSDSYIRSAVNYEHDIIKRANAVFCMGEWLTDCAKEVYKDCAHKIYTAPGGINTIDNFPEIARDTNTVLFVGRDFYRKGGDLVFKAVQIAREKIKKDIKLIVAGPKRNPIDCDYNWYSFRGDVSNEEISKLMATSNIFCMPSRFEAFGLVFPEALISGLPCIGRDEFEMSHFIDEGVTGEFIHYNEPELLATKICKILEDSSYARNVIRRHADYLTKYNWEKTASFIDDIICKL